MNTPTAHAAVAPASPAPPHASAAPLTGAPAPPPASAPPLTGAPAPSLAAVAPSAPVAAPSRCSVAPPSSPAPAALRCAVALPYPAAAPPPPVRALSYTSLAEYARCGYRFYAQRVLGLPDVPPPGRRAPRGGRLDARSRGVLVHALLESSAASPPDAAAVRARATELGIDATAGELEHVRALAAAFASSEVAVRLRTTREVAREREFAFELTPGGGPLLTGVVDLLAVEPDGPWLIADAKTDRVGADEDLEALTEREYGVQRRLYALAALRAGAPAVEVVHVYLERGGESAWSAYTHADESALTAELSQLAGGIADGAFAVTDEPHARLCATCPARDTLCPHPRERTLRPAAEPAT